MITRSRLGRAALAAALALTALSTGPARAAGPNATTPDPAAPGPFEAQRAEYNLTERVPVGVGEPGSTAATILDMRLAGDISYPGKGAGPFPVLLFLHGNHATCESGPGSQLGLLVDPFVLQATYDNGTCRTDSAQADALLSIREAKSYQGYDYLSERLATQGYIVASLDINDITDWTNNAAESGYLARAEIMSKTLDLIGTWNTQTGPNGIGDGLKGRVDLSRVGVMGHSRGGEGVNQFAEYNQTRPATAAEAIARKDPENPAKAQPVPDVGPRYDLKGVFSLAPVDNQGARKPVVSGTDFATLLPYCDGDVYDLEGAPVFERSKNGLGAGGHIAAQYLVNGANHDYFNTVWTEDDANLFGFGDPYCNVAAGPTRLQAPEQRQIGITLIGGFLRATVGGETQFDPIVRGESLPPAACPNDGVDPPVMGPTCRNVVQTSYVAPHRRVLIAPETASVPTKTPGGDPITTAGFTVSACTATAGTLLVTTGCGGSPNRSYGPQLTLDWTGESTLTVTPLEANRDISAFATLSFRASENSTQAQQLPVEDQIRVTLTDTAGHAASVLTGPYSAALEPPPGTTARKQVLNGVRIPLNAFTGVDLAHVKTIVLGAGVDTLTGSIQFNDLALQEPAFVPGPGPTNPSGPSGPSGPEGTASPVGSPGPSGPAGADATTPSGSAGPAGPAGPAGTPGADAGGTPAAGRCRTVKVLLHRHALRVLKRRGLGVRSTCATRRPVTVVIRASEAGARRAGLAHRRLARVVRTLAPRQLTRVRIRRAPARRLVRLHRLTLTVHVR